MSGALTRNFKSEKTSRKRSASPVKREVLKRQKSNDAQESPVPQCDPSGELYDHSTLLFTADRELFRSPFCQFPLHSRPPPKPLALWMC